VGIFHNRPNVNFSQKFAVSYYQFFYSFSNKY
jgi:hypothetical protein